MVVVTGGKESAKRGAVIALSGSCGLVRSAEVVSVPASKESAWVHHRRPEGTRRPTEADFAELDRIGRSLLTARLRALKGDEREMNRFSYLACCAYRLMDGELPRYEHLLDKEVAEGSEEHKDHETNRVSAGGLTQITYKHHPGSRISTVGSIAAAAVV
jgi:hypothetical protein